MRKCRVALNVFLANFARQNFRKIKMKKENKTNVRMFMKVIFVFNYALSNFLNTKPLKFKWPFFVKILISRRFAKLFVLAIISQLFSLRNENLVKKSKFNLWYDPFFNANLHIAKPLDIKVSIAFSMQSSVQDQISCGVHIWYYLKERKHIMHLWSFYEIFGNKL